MHVCLMMTGTVDRDKPQHSTHGSTTNTLSLAALQPLLESERQRRLEQTLLCPLAAASRSLSLSLSLSFFIRNVVAYSGSNE